jgi:membrane protease YdiL (CAAX protease family)
VADSDLRHPERPEGAPTPPPEAGPEPDPREAPPPDWPLWTAFAALFAGFLAANLLGAVVYGIASANGHDEPGDAPIGYVVTAQLLFSACLVGAAVGFARMSGRVTPATFGLRTTRLGPAVGWAFAAYATYLVGSLIWLNALNVDDEQDSITERLADDPTTATVVGLAIFAVVVAPIVEEVVFRGFIFNVMRGKLPVVWAAIVTGLLFGLVHVFGSPIEFLLPLALLGTVLCLLYWKTGSLLPCIAVHALNNCIALASALDWSWQIPVLMAGALAVISAILLPIVRRGREPVAPASPA